MIHQDSHARQSPPSVTRPEVGLGLLPRDQLPQLRSRYIQLLQALGASPAAAFMRGIIRQIDGPLLTAEVPS
jgi:hypothetical protein